MKKFEYDPVAIVERINEAEKIFPVNEWKVNGVAFWPFIRTSLAYTQRKDLVTAVSSSKKKSNSRGDLLKKYSKVLLLLPFHIWRFKRNLRNAKRLFVGAATHRININGLRANKYFDVAITDFNKQQNASLVLDRGTSLKSSDYPNRNVWFSLPALYVWFEMLRRFRLAGRNSYDIKLNGYDEFHLYLADNFLNAEYLKSNFSKRSIISKMKIFHDRKEYLKGLLKKSEVKNTYFLCYYSSLYYPLIAACNELGIHTIDVQHGGMGKGHWSYDNWSVAPPNGYLQVPQFFWNWDAGSAALINAWAQRTGFHKAFNLGRPWLHDYTQVSSYKPARVDYILYNLADVTLEDYIIEAIKQTGSQRPWVCRMHPRMVKQRNLLEQQIAQHGISGVAFIEDSTQVALSDSLQFCSSFISAGSSGSVIEALQAGLIPVLLPSPGANYYEEYIRENQVKVLMEKDTDKLVTLLEESKVRYAGASEATTSSAYENRFREFEKTIGSR